MNAPYYAEDACDLTTFEAQCSAKTTAKDVPLAAAIKSEIPLYDMATLGDHLASPAGRQRLMGEWAHVLAKGAGALVLKAAQPDHEAIDLASQAYNAIIADEKVAGGGGADHFAAAGSNDRIWNSLQKLAMAAPDVFVRYFASPGIDAVCEAWLGPNYQMTAQVNLVHPGGAAQEAHRDYHLGFQTSADAARYPAHVHHLSPYMTLQGGIAHMDIPIESGPTKLLPFSQNYGPGYVAFRRPEFRAYFEEHNVQLPLAKGDALFFSPALFHAAGDNRSSDVHRMVNLLQVSSPFGRAMETVDRAGMCRTLYPALMAARATGALSGPGLDAVIASVAEGYPFPTNLDTDPPVGGLAPESQAGLLRRALEEGMSPEAFASALAAQDNKRSA